MYSFTLAESKRSAAAGPGWIKDKFGVSWQIVPATLSSLLQSRDGDKGKRVMYAMMTMAKLDIATLEW